MGESELKHATEADAPLIGSWASIPHPSTAELAASAGYDFVAPDVEHSPLGYETLADMLRAVDAADGHADTLVRVPDDDPTTLKRTLDLGPDAILVPMVHTAQQAEGIVEATRFPPGGARGIGPGRATEYSLSLADHVADDDDAFATHVQLESERAIENAAEIAAVDGVDGVFIGPMDLSMSLDCFADWESETFRDAVEQAVLAGREAGVAVGTFATSAAEREQRLGWDVDYLVAGVDLLHVAEGATDALAHSREFLEE